MALKGQSGYIFSRNPASQPASLHQKHRRQLQALTSFVKHSLKYNYSIKSILSKLIADRTLFYISIGFCNAYEKLYFMIPMHHENNNVHLYILFREKDETSQICYYIIYLITHLLMMQCLKDFHKPS